MRLKKSNINIAVVLRMMGWLLMIEAAFMLIPIGVGAAYSERLSMMSFVYSFLITGGAGALMTFGIHPHSTDMHKREGLLLTAIVWVFFSFFGMLPFLFDGTLSNVSDAFFEAMSGFTTTGASVIKDVESASHPILIWRALIQWIGGMGIILFTLAVIPMLNHQGGIQLFNAEVTGITHDKLRPRISQTAKGLWLVYIVLTIVLGVLLWIGPMNLFDAVCHTLSTISTGGFSTKNTSIEWWNSEYVEIILTLFMFIGGINFSLLFKAASGNFSALFKNGTFIWYVGIYLVFTILSGLSMWNDGILEKWYDIAFMCTSAMTSTGYTSLNIENCGQFVIMVMLLLMFCGSCAGSTSGGAKVDRIEFLIKNSRNEFYRVLHPNSIIPVRVNSKVVSGGIVMKVIAFLCIYLMLVVLGTIVLTWMDVPVFDAFFSSMSMTGNGGLGIGVTGTGGSYANLPSLSKWVMSFLMLVGRLELFTVLILFTKDFWSK